MSLSVYDASIPVFLRALNVLSTLLDKGAEHATANHTDPRALVEARLAPDMLTLAGQMQRASDSAKGCAARLTGQEAPGMPDTETTIPDLKSRISRTIAYLESFGPEQFEHSDLRTVTLNVGREPVSFDGKTYLLTFALPNFFFISRRPMRSCGTRACRSVSSIISGRVRDRLSAVIPDEQSEDPEPVSFLAAERDDGQRSVLVRHGSGFAFGAPE